MSESSFFFAHTIWNKIEQYVQNTKVTSAAKVAFDIVRQLLHPLLQQPMCSQKSEKKNESSKIEV